MNSQLESKVFVLTGPYAGRTMVINGHRFVGGKCVVHAPAHHMQGAERYLGEYYQAFPEGSAAHLAATKEASDGKRDTATPAEPGQQTNPVPGGVQPDGAGAGEEATGDSKGDGDSSSGAEGDQASGEGHAGTDDETQHRLNRIKKAIDKLDPKNKDHWGKDKRPTVAAVSNALGEAVSRAEIDAVLAEQDTKSK